MENTLNNPTGPVARLMELIETLRGENGCPWDRKQTPKSVAVYLVEETFELVNAIESGETAAVMEELGDVLFQVLFILALYQERGQFDLEQMIRAISEKMIRRHPHVFGGEPLQRADQVKKQWHEIKREEKNGAQTESILDSIPSGLPALMRAFRISDRAAASGFDWNDITGVMEKVREEWHEFASEMDGKPLSRIQTDKVSLEFGDILFTLVNVARFVKIHPEIALTEAVQKFQRRFRYMERRAKESGKVFENLPRTEKEKYWNEAKMRDE